MCAGPLGYRGKNEHLAPGALLALPRQLPTGRFPNPRQSRAGMKAAAFRDYGGYIIDDTASDSVWHCVCRFPLSIQLLTGRGGVAGIVELESGAMTYLPKHTITRSTLQVGHGTTTWSKFSKGFMLSPTTTRQCWRWRSIAQTTTSSLCPI